MGDINENEVLNEISAINVNNTVMPIKDSQARNDINEIELAIIENNTAIGQRINDLNGRVETLEGAQGSYVLNQEFADQSEVIATALTNLNTRVVTLEGSQGTLGPQGTQGSKGEDGAQGTQGEQGIQGSKGDDGDVGADGAQGTQGDQGAQGTVDLSILENYTLQQDFLDNEESVAIAILDLTKKYNDLTNGGAQGSGGGTGAQGNQGAMGLTGHQGEQGVQGSKGDDGYVGADGVQGSQGEQGMQGAQGSVDLSVLEDYTLKQDTLDNEEVISAALVDLNDRLSYLEINGSQGSQGTGGNGAQGSQGAQGAQGSKGDDGYVGADGPQGTQGTQGAQGSFDPSMLEDYVLKQDIDEHDEAIAIAFADLNSRIETLEGSQGTLGPQGAQGSMGLIGPQGAKGEAIYIEVGEDTQVIAGPQGDQGSQGDRGADGYVGADGAQGTQGEQGLQGSIGDTGVQGTQGSIGEVGPQGAQGSQGTFDSSALANYLTRQEASGLGVLPSASSSDNGKVLAVVNGAYSLINATNMFSGSTSPSNLYGYDGDLYVQIIE